MVIVFRGTETTKEWIENATLFMQLLEGEPTESGFALIFNHSVGLVHRQRIVANRLVALALFTHSYLLRSKPFFIVQFRFV